MKKRNQVGTIGRVEKTSEHFMSSTGGKSIFKKPTASGASQGTSIDSKEPPFAMWESIINLKAFVGWYSIDIDISLIYRCSRILDPPGYRYVFPWTTIFKHCEFLSVEP